jgi:polysaccharide chain length determinant protein (PEP-CTERM system associated)
MEDLLEKLRDDIRGSWRFRWIAVAVAWTVALAGWAVVFMMPDMYQASARVFVDTRTTLNQVTQGIAVESNVDTQILRVRQSLIGGPQLEKVARDARVEPRAGATPQMVKEFYDEVRKRIQITGSTTRDSATGGVYLLTYTDRDRKAAIRLVKRLTDAFVDNTTGGKREGSEQAQKFLVDQLREYEGRLAGAEQRLAEFKKTNVGLMPGVQGDYFSRLQSEIDQADKAKAALNLASRRRDELQRQLRGEAPVLSGAQPAVPGAGASSDIASRIRDTQQKLDEMLLRFTDRHPDVIALRQTLDDLTARQQSQIEALRRGDAGAAAGIGLAANPVYQNIQLQLNQANVEIATLNAEIGDRQRKIGELRERVNTAPEVEAGLSRLNRDYEVTRASYQALLERLEKARLSDQAEQTGIVRFEIIDPPAASFSPVAPKRSLFLIGILLFALGAGGGLAYLLHLMRAVFSNARQLQTLAGRPVIGWVSKTRPESYKADQRRGLLSFAAATSMLLFTASILLVAQWRLVQLIHH